MFAGGVTMPGLLTIAVVIFATHPQRADYQITRAQLDAMTDLRFGRAETRYVWDRKLLEVWAKPAVLPTAKSLENRVPLIGFASSSFWTTDRTLKAATAFPDLAVVNLSYCWRVSDEGIHHLKSLKQLKVLIMYRNSARFAGTLLPHGLSVEKAETIPQRLTDEALTHISSMETLEVLNIAHNEFGKNAVLKLQNLKSLQRLTVDDRQASPEVITALRTALPGCKIVVWTGIPRWDKHAAKAR